METIVHNGIKLNYNVERRMRKTVSIRVNSRKGIEVSAPSHLSDEGIKEILLDNWGRLQGILDNIKKNDDFKKLASGDKIPLMGREYPVRFIECDGKVTGVEFKDDIFHIYVDNNHASGDGGRCIRAALREWYINRARRVFRDRVTFYSQIMKLYPQDIRIKGQKSLWGSCSSSNNLNFNYKLLLAPPEVLDYVVVHELAHIRYKNHSHDFWNFVELYMPDCKNKRDWLKQNGHRLEIFED